MDKMEQHTPSFVGIDVSKRISMLIVIPMDRGVASTTIKPAGARRENG
jgi:hypothetical protein